MRLHFRGRRVRVEGEAGYREVWLTRPDARNALDMVMRDELFETLGAIAMDGEIAAVALLAEGPDFCAGGDLAEFGTSTSAVVAAQIRLVRSLPALVAALHDRLVVGIQGAAVGAGIELAAFARTIVASTDARFRLPELTMGLLPGSGGTVSIPRRIGRHRTLAMLLDGGWRDAGVALADGLVDEVVVRSRLLDRVREVARP